MKIQPRQLKKLHLLLNSLDMMDEKPELVFRFTSHRETSSKNMLYHEADSLIKALESLATQSDDPLDKMRKKMLSIGYTLGFDQAKSEAQKQLPASQVNLINVNAWCKSKFCKIRKALGEMDAKQLNQALSQFESFKKNTLNARSATKN